MTHPLVPLARGHACQIEHCADCNILHVTLGPITVRLEPGAAHQLHRCLAEALRRLEAQPSAVSDHGAPLPH